MPHTRITSISTPYSHHLSQSKNHLNHTSPANADLTPLVLVIAVFVDLYRPIRKQVEPTFEHRFFALFSIANVRMAAQGA